MCPNVIHILSGKAKRWVFRSFFSFLLWRLDSKEMDWTRWLQKSGSQRRRRRIENVPRSFPAPGVPLVSVLRVDTMSWAGRTKKQDSLLFIFILHSQKKLCSAAFGPNRRIWYRLGLRVATFWPMTGMEQLGSIDQLYGQRGGNPAVPNVAGIKGKKRLYKFLGTFLLACSSQRTKERRSETGLPTCRDDDLDKSGLIWWLSS